MSSETRQMGARDMKEDDNVAVTIRTTEMGAKGHKTERQN